MAVTQNTYTGNGSTVLYSFTFPYLETTDIKVSLNGTVTTAYTLANATTIQFNTAPANGAAIRIYRQTDDSALAATFYPGSAIRSNDLNENFTQNLYVTQESSNNAATATSTANTALTNSNTAISTANAATATANTASSNASAAVATANTASTNASAAVSTANTAAANATTAINTANSATATANSATSTANTALSTANSAVTTANSASTAATNAVNTANAASAAASSAVTTANTASANATTAVNTANSATTTANSATTTANTANAKADQAIAAVSNSINFQLKANVAAIPASPTNDTYIEVQDSTGLESFTPLAGKPAGFVGDSGLSVRLRYTSAGSTWNWLNYYANNSETRYLKLSGGTLTGQLKADDSTSTAAPVYSFDGDTNTGIAHTGADELALVTGGTPRLTIDGSGNATFSNSVTLPAGSTVSGYLDTTTAAATYAPLASPTFTGTATAPSVTVTGSTAPTNGVYLPAANSVAISTNGTRRLLVDANSNLLVGAPDANSCSVSIGDGATGNREAYLDFVGDTTYTDYGTRISRSPGANGITYFAHRGTGALSILAQDAAPVTISTSGSERLRISSAGLVGIGTSSVSYKLDINNTSGGNGGFRLLSTDQSTTRIRLENTGVGGRSYEIVGGLTGVDNSTFTVYDATAAATRLAIDSSGRVGIGTTSPGATLDVAGNQRFSAANSVLEFNNGGPQIFVPGANTLAFATGGGIGSPTERARIDSSGRLGLGTSSPATRLDVSGAQSANITAVAALNIDCSLGNLFTKTINGNSTFTVSNVPASRSYAFTLELTHTSGTITWFSGVVWPGGTAPTLTTGKVHLFMFFTDDGGTTWRASSLTNY